MAGGQVGYQMQFAGHSILRLLGWPRDYIPDTFVGLGDCGFNIDVQGDPNHMKQVIRRGLKEIIVDEVPDPVVVPGHVIVRTHFSLISSGTETASIHREGLIRGVAEHPSYVRKIWDVAKVQGPFRTAREVVAKLSEYAVLGYSGAGVIVQKHTSVTNLEIGDRVTYGGEGTGHAEFVSVGRNLVSRVPDNVPLQHACFTTLGSIALNAVRTAQVQLGEFVAVMGLGLVGQLIAQLVRLQGGIVIGVDLKRDRLEKARLLGADHVVEAAGQIREDFLSLTNGRGVDTVIVAAASKSAIPCEQALDICRDRGKIVVVGAVDLSFPWEQMYLKEITLLMSRAYGPGSYDPKYEIQCQDYPFAHVRWTENRNMEEFLRLLSTGAISVKDLITHLLPFQEATNAYDTILNPASGSLGVVLQYSAATDTSIEPSKPIHNVQILREQSFRAGKIGVALVGAGNLARWEHLPHINRISGTELKAICSTSGSRSKSYGLRFGASYCCTEYDCLLEDPGIHVIAICTRNEHHARQAAAALNAGKHVFVEKPMALTELECRTLYDAFTKSDRLLTVGFNRRFAPAYQCIRDVIRRRTGPAVLNCRINSPGISGNYWMADPSTGGAILGEACHFVDLMYWLLGSEPVEVSAYTLPAGKGEPIGENNLAASFRFADGSIGNLTYCTVGSRTSGGERVEAFAAGIGASADSFRTVQVKTAFSTGKRFWIPQKGYFAQMKQFIDCIRNGRGPEVGFIDGARATIGCLRMLESARDHCPKQINLETIDR